MNPFRLTTRLRAVPPSGHVEPRSSARGAGSGTGSGSASDPEPGARLAGEADAAAIRVPWRVVHRSASGVIEVEQCGAGPLHSVRFALAGEGLLGLSLPRTVYPGERVRVVVRGSSAERAAASGDAMLMMRWFQSDGTELLWPIAL